MIFFFFWSWSNMLMNYIWTYAMFKFVWCIIFLKSSGVTVKKKLSFERLSFALGVRFCNNFFFSVLIFWFCFASATSMKDLWFYYFVKVQSWTCSQSVSTSGANQVVGRTNCRLFFKSEVYFSKLPSLAGFPQKICY